MSSTSHQEALGGAEARWEEVIAGKRQGSLTSPVASTLPGSLAWTQGQPWSMCACLHASGVISKEGQLLTG